MKKNRKPIEVIVLFLLTSLLLFSCGNKMLEVSFELNMYVNTEYELCVQGKTNLPNNTKLLLSLTDNTSKELLCQTEAIVNNQSITFNPLFPDGIGIGDGEYGININLGLPSLQSANVQNVIGKNGEKLSGKFVVENQNQKTIEYKDAIAINGSPVKSLADRRKEKETTTSENKTSSITQAEKLRNPLIMAAERNKKRIVQNGTKNKTLGTMLVVEVPSNELMTVTGKQLADFWTECISDWMFICIVETEENLNKYTGNGLFISPSIKNIRMGAMNINTDDTVNFGNISKPLREFFYLSDTNSFQYYDATDSDDEPLKNLSNDSLAFVGVWY